MRTSDIKTLLPTSNCAPVLFALSITLRISYVSLDWKGVTKFWFSTSIVLRLISILLTLKDPIITCSFLFNISNWSPTFRDDLSIGVRSVYGPCPSTWNLVLVLYFHEFANISLYVELLFCIFSPTFLTNIFSPSVTKFISDTGTNSDKTPVILKSILLDKLPFSYPKILSFDRISSAVLIPTTLPVQPKNWLIDFDV